MARNKFCVRVDKLNPEQKKELHAQVDKVVSDYNKKAREQEEENEEAEEQ